MVPPRWFAEKGMDFVDLLLNEPIFTLMERVFGDRMHIIALQGHRMVSGNEISRFHADEIYLQRPEDVGDDVEYPPPSSTRSTVTITSWTCRWIWGRQRWFLAVIAPVDNQRPKTATRRVGGVSRPCR